MKTMFDPRKLLKLFRSRPGNKIVVRRVVKMEKNRKKRLSTLLRKLDEFEKASKRNMKKNPIFVR